MKLRTGLKPRVSHIICNHPWIGDNTVADEASDRETDILNTRVPSFQTGVTTKRFSMRQKCAKPPRLYLWVTLSLRTGNMWVVAKGQPKTNQRGFVADYRQIALRTDIRQAPTD